MSMVDSFINELDGDEKFYNYLSCMSKNELLNAVDEEYYALKGTSNLSPYMGECGSFEFVGALLLWKYASEQWNASGNSKGSFGSLLISLADTIGCAFNHMSPGEWSDKIDVVINSHDDVLTYSEWSKVYNYLDDNYSTEIHECEFNDDTLIQRLDNEKKYRDSFVTLYNSLPNFNSVIEYYSSQGLGLKNKINFRITN